MIMDMGTLRITEAELARDVHAILAKVQQGVEVVVEQDHRPVATIRTPLPKGRLLSESIALAEARGTTAIPDEGFMKDARRRDRGTQPATEPAHLGVILDSSIMIEAERLERGYAVATRNQRHFQKIPGLKLISL